jgi:hypothetical protein
LEGQTKPPRTPIGAFFAHPATLLLIAGVVTALLSGLLVPHVTRGWQANDRKLERRSQANDRKLERRNAILHEELGVKVRLVKLAGAASANFLGASQLRSYGEPANAAGLTKYDKAYVDWSIASAEVASQLAAYFPGSSAQTKWDNFTLNMRNTYYLIRDHQGDERQEWLKRVRKYLQEFNPKLINGIRQKPLNGTSRNQTYEAALRELLYNLQKKEALVVSVIVDSPSSLQTSKP